MSELARADDPLVEHARAFAERSRERSAIEAFHEAFHEHLLLFEPSAP